MPTLSDLENDLSTMEKEMQGLVRRFTTIAGQQAASIVKLNFVLQGYDDGVSFKAWAERSEATNRMYDKGYGANKGGNLYVYSSSNPILVQSKNLRNAISYRAHKYDVDVGVYDSMIGTHNAVDYGQENNEGSDVVPQRQFMPTPMEGPNEKIMANIEGRWKSEEAKIMNKFK
jgi:hypothetical protein